MSSQQPTATDPDAPVMEVRDLRIEYLRDGVRTVAVDDVSFKIMPGEAFGLVGESGSGKSTIAFSLVRYLAGNATVHGDILFEGRSVPAMSHRALRTYRGTGAAMIYQDPTSALNPSMTVGKQVAEVFKLHSSMNRGQIREATENVLREVSFTDPAAIMRRYPHQLSGGQQQRICIAMAIASEPRILILDEPTTGLDLSVQADVLKLLHRLHITRGMAMLYISHDLATVRKVCSRVGIMRNGKLVEQDEVEKIFTAPEHEYTQALLDCIPLAGAHKSTVRLKTITESLSTSEVAEALADPEAWASRPKQSEPVLEAVGLTKTFGAVTAANEVGLQLRPGEILGIVGESGSGKSTLARLIAGLTIPDAGEVLFDGGKVARDIADRNLEQRRGIQMVFQRPDTTLNPVLTVRTTLQRSIDRLRGKKSPAELMTEVQLDPAYLEYSPRRLSGGMKQRVAIARALAGGAEVVICDEATSALDPSIQSSILNQIVDLARERGTAFIFISHNLDAVRYVSDRIMVVYLGEVVERGEVNAVLDDPQHDYTKRLVGSSVDNIQWDDVA